MADLYPVRRTWPTAKFALHVQLSVCVSKARARLPLVTTHYEAGSIGREELSILHFV